MSSGDIETIALRVYDEIASDRNLALIDELYARDCSFYYPRAPLGVQGSDALDELRNALAFFHGAFSDFRFEIEEQVAEGSTVVLRWTIRGTHDGKLLSPLGEIPPTGRQVCLQGPASCGFERTSSWSIGRTSIVWGSYSSSTRSRISRVDSARCWIVGMLARVVGARVRAANGTQEPRALCAFGSRCERGGWRRARHWGARVWSESVT